MSERLVDFADKFMDLVRDQAEWSQATFGSDSERGPMGALKHLEKEARECQEAVRTPELREELADCLLLLLDASRRAGIKPTQLVEAAQAKMVTNKQRTWPKPTSDEPIEHVRSIRRPEGWDKRLSMRVSRRTRLELSGMDGGRLAVEYDNIGEPFREGVLLSFEDDSVQTGNWIGVLLDPEDAIRLRDKLNELLS